MTDRLTIAEIIVLVGAADRLRVVFDTSIVGPSERGAILTAVNSSEEYSEVTKGNYCGSVILDTEYFFRLAVDYGDGHDWDSGACVLSIGSREYLPADF